MVDKGKCGSPYFMLDEECKSLGRGAYGYWGRPIYKEILADNIDGKEQANLRDMIEVGGIKVALWLGVTEGNQCSCYKKTHRSADRKCSTCHGVIGGKVPGYVKWGYHTEWMSSVDSDIILTDVEITKDFNSSKVILQDGKLSGTIESGDKVFNRTAFGSYWETTEVSFLRTTYGSVTVEYSLDSGSTWQGLSQLAIDNPVSGSIRFRATLQRDDADVLSPLFEIVRARFSEIPREEEVSSTGTSIERYNRGPWIKVLPNVPGQGYRKHAEGSGDFPSVDGYTFWTVGMSYFDSRIELGSDEEMLNGPNIIFEVLEGALKGKKFLVTNWSLSDPRGTIIMTQTFKVRIEDPVGFASLVW